MLFSNIRGAVLAKGLPGKCLSGSQGSKPLTKPDRESAGF